ncbi:protein mono-ADP-ribosyltransferase PARP4 isoform X1 [Channa argus]|uniref:protein mono-ADP-ribosyltransferase PARP4 isoform X1 n=1 Tax=Channa argus TaxID=215402 RepID=UPI00352168C2
MAVFEKCAVLLELKGLPFKEKKKLKSAITENGGSLSFVVNKQCSLIVTGDVSNLSASRLRSIHKHQTPVVGVGYVFACLDRGVLLPVDEYKLEMSSPFGSSLTSVPVFSPTQVSKIPTKKAVVESPKDQAKPVDSVRLTRMVEAQERSGNVLDKFRIYTESDSDLPTYPDNFQVAKYSVFNKINSNTWCVLELQSVKTENGRQYRVVRYWNNDIVAKKAAVRDMLVFPPTSEDALEVYLALRETLQNTGLQLQSDIPLQARDLGSSPLQQLLLEEKLNTGSLSQDVGVFVELLWTEALGCLGSILRVSIDKLSLNDVSRAEGLLLQAQRKLSEANHTEATSLLEEVYTLLPHRAPQLPPNAKLISQKLDLCQLLRDVLNVSEMTLRSPMPSCLGKYRALRCSIETVPSSSSEFRAVTALLQNSKVQIQQVLRVSRGVELQMFKSELGNIKPLLHSSGPSNFVGILSRGLLLPRVGVEHHGIERTDVGNLGSGIYFSDAVSTSLKYSRPSETDGSRLLLVCDVALGRCWDVHNRDVTLTQAPEGHHSVHGVRRTPKVQSEFEDDEYVVYSPDQVQLKYVVQFSLEGEQLMEFSPAIDTLAELCLPSSDQELSAEDDGIESIKNPLDDVKAGLLDSSGQQLPLQSVHVRCKLVDLLSQVVIFQKYTNMSSVPIEAKYVFPLDDSAAVCGFEAFINGKHVVGQVKEKETARREYKQAIEKGHGAYLMDQDAPDVFTISVGNLPPGATVLIKVTFVSELIVRDGSILFSLPGSVAPWQESAALNQTTQVTVEKVCVTDEAASTRDFTLDMSVEMPYEISSLKCITHNVKIKKTDCKAVVSVLPGEVMGSEGFQLSVTLSEVHLPRMWVEKHPDKDSQACMLVFYPDFDINCSSAYDEVVLLLDTSESMKGESLHTAQRIALQVLKSLNQNLRVNVILFGTDHTEAFLTAQPLVEARQAAERFVKLLSPVGGSTELWRPLRALSLLPPTNGIRNLVLLSDGHIQNPDLTLQLLRDNAQHSRLFTCGLSATANRHMLRALAQAGGGAYEFFDTKTKHNWTEKVACQVKRMTSPGCNSVSVKWQQFNPRAPVPVQAPKQIHALFNDCHTLVYGFVPHCTQATLLGNLGGQELKTMVSTSELQKTRGTFLHKLTARALIRDYEDGNLDADEAEHEGKKAELKSFIVELSKEYSILSQFTSFVAIEERDSEITEQGVTDIPKLIAEEDVDFLPYIRWVSPQQSEEEESESEEELEEESACCYYTADCYIDLFETFDELPEGRYQSNLLDELEDEDEVYVDKDNDDEWSEEKRFSEAVENSSDEATISPQSLHHMDVLCVPPPPRSFIPTTFIPCLPQSSAVGGSVNRVYCSLSPAPPDSTPLSPPSVSHLCGQFSPHASVAALHSADFSRAPSSPAQSFALFGSAAPVLCGLPPAPIVSAAPCPPSGRFAFSQISSHDSVHPLRSAFRPPFPAQGSPFIGSAAPASSAPPAAPLIVAPSFPSVQFSADSSLSPPVPCALSSDALPPPPSAQSSVVFGSAPTPVYARRLKRSSLQACESLEIPGIADKINLEDDLQRSEKNRVAEAQEETTRFTRSARRLNLREKSYAAPLRARLAKKPFRAHDEHASQTDIKEPRSLRKKLPDPEALKLQWTNIFQMQDSEGYWELTTELGELINVDLDTFANVFLKNKGINSLGVTARAAILRLVATLLVLQLMRVKKLEEGKLLRTLFSLDDSQPRPERWEDVKRAVDWVSWADRQYPSAYSRLEFGLSWESSTRQLLGFDSLPPFSPLRDLNLQKTTSPVMVY